MSSMFFQPLEGRQFLSASVKGETPNPKLADDMKQYQADIQQYKNDATLMNTTLTADRAKVAADMKAIAGSKTDAKVKLAADQKAMMVELKADGEAGNPTYLKWKVVLDADTKAIKEDGDNKDKRATDQAKYDADFKAFRDEMAPFETETHADIEKWNKLVAADRKACETGNTDLCKELKTDQMKLSTDEKHFKELLAADQKKINTDILQMKKDGGGDHKDGDKKTEPTKPEPKK